MFELSPLTVVIILACITIFVAVGSIAVRQALGAWSLRGLPEEMALGTVQLAVWPKEGARRLARQWWGNSISTRGLKWTSQTWGKVANVEEPTDRILGLHVYLDDPGMIVGRIRARTADTYIQMRLDGVDAWVWWHDIAFGRVKLRSGELLEPGGGTVGSYRREGGARGQARLEVRGVYIATLKTERHAYSRAPKAPEPLVGHCAKSWGDEAERWLLVVSILELSGMAEAPHQRRF